MIPDQHLDLRRLNRGFEATGLSPGQQWLRPVTWIAAVAWCAAFWIAAGYGIAVVAGAV